MTAWLISQLAWIPSRYLSKRGVSRNLPGILYNNYLQGDSRFLILPLKTRAKIDLQKSTYYTDYKAVFAILLGTAYFHPCSLFLTDAMLPVSPCCTDITTVSAPRNSRRLFLPAKHLSETQDLPQMPIPISLRLNLLTRISTCKAFSHEQQPYGIHSLPIASQTAITLFLSRKGLIEFSFCLSSPCNP